MAELWEYQKRPTEKWTSIQLFKNSKRKYNSYIYYLELKPSYQGIHRRHSTAHGTNNEYSYRPNYIQCFWKVKIQRMNCKDCSDKLTLNIVEDKYKEIILNETFKLIKTIEKVSKSQIKSIKTMFLIEDDACIY